MTDAEIIKALECFSSTEQGCKGCPFIEIGCFDCGYIPIEISQNILALINRQKAEIDTLKTLVKITKAEAIHEFTERLKKSAFECDVSFGYGKEHHTKAVTVIEIDNLVKEMEGKKDV